MFLLNVDISKLMHAPNPFVDLFFGPSFIRLPMVKKWFGTAINIETP
jgi:hypothetical protein